MSMAYCQEQEIFYLENEQLVIAAVKRRSSVTAFASTFFYVAGWKRLVIICDAKKTKPVHFHDCFFRLHLFLFSSVLLPFFSSPVKFIASLFLF